MAAKSLKSLEKSYETENYFEVVLTSYINGNLAQCKEQFNQMKKADRKDFLIWLVNEYCAYSTKIMNIVL